MPQTAALASSCSARVAAPRAAARIVCVPLSAALHRPPAAAAAAAPAGRRRRASVAAAARADDDVQPVPPAPLATSMDPDDLQSDAECEWLLIQGSGITG